MLIFVRGLSGTVTPLNVSPHDSVLSIKIRIFYLKNISVHDQHLLYSGVELTDQTILSTVNIGHGALLLLVLGLRTGPLGRYDLCTSINQKYSNNDISSQSTTNNNDETEYTRLLSLLSSSSSYPSVSSSSAAAAPTVIFPSICVTAVVNATKIASDELEQTETNLLMNSFESYNDNNDDTINSNCFTSSDDEIYRIAEILGYAIDNNEQLLSPSLYDFPTTVTDESQLYDHDNNDIDETDIYYHYEQSFSPPQQLSWAITPSYNSTQQLNIPETNSYELCDNINSNNNSFQYIHGFKTIETPSKHYQSTDSLFDKTNTSTSTTTSSSTNSVIMNSSYDQLKDNSIFSSLKEESYLSSPNVNFIVDNNNNNNNNNNRNNNHTIVDVKRSTRNDDRTTAMIVHNDDDDDDFHLDRHYSNSNTIPLLNTTTNTTGNTTTTIITHLHIPSGDNSIIQLLNNSTINFINNPLIINHFQSLINSPCSYSFYLMMQMKLLCNNQFHSNEYLFNLIPNNNNNTIVMNRRTLYTNHSNHLNNNEYNITEKLLNDTRRYNRQTEINLNCNDNDDFRQMCLSNTTIDRSSSHSLQSLSSSSPPSSSSSSSSFSCNTTIHSNQSRCYECNRRTRLACGFTCRCERWFCSRHHHPEDHRCNFKFKTMVN
uniref:Ubiquitin-like domain-containing protein n=1 Tax=Schistosoma haematobium TaxID=6185 RepID=A0A095A5J4_SCHHA